MRSARVLLELTIDSNSSAADLNRQLKKVLPRLLEAQTVENSRQAGFTTVLCADVIQAESEEM